MMPCSIFYSPKYGSMRRQGVTATCCLLKTWFKRARGLPLVLRGATSRSSTMRMLPWTHRALSHLISLLACPRHSNNILLDTTILWCCTQRVRAIHNALDERVVIKVVVFVLGMWIRRRVENMGNILIYLPRARPMRVLLILWVLFKWTLRAYL